MPHQLFSILAELKRIDNRFEQFRKDSEAQSRRLSDFARHYSEQMSLAVALAKENIERTGRPF